MEDPFLIKHLILRWYDLLIRIQKKKKKCGGQKHKYTYLVHSQVSTEIHIHCIKTLQNIILMKRESHQSPHTHNSIDRYRIIYTLGI